MNDRTEDVGGSDESLQDLRLKVTRLRALKLRLEVYRRLIELVVLAGAIAGAGHLAGVL